MPKFHQSFLSEFSRELTMRLSILIFLSNLIFLFIFLIQLHSTGNGGVEAKRVCKFYRKQFLFYKKELEGTKVIHGVVEKLRVS